jgi:gas vesicle structural protein
MNEQPLRRTDDLSLAELVNRVLDRGALISGEVTIGVAGVDLIYLSLQLAISSVEAMEQRAARTIDGDDPTAA